MGVGRLTTSTAEADCEPYEAGKSEIKRRYTVEHRYKNPGGFRVVLRLKKGTKMIATANTAGSGPRRARPVIGGVRVNVGSQSTAAALGVGARRSASRRSAAAPCTSGRTRS